MMKQNFSYMLLMSAASLYAAADKQTVASGANANDTLICAQERMQQLTAEVNILEKKDFLLVTRMAALAAWGTEYARLQKQLTQQAIPGIKLCETVIETIVANGELQYSQ